MQKGKAIGLVSGPLLFIAFFLLSAGSENGGSQTALGFMLWMSIWLVARPVSQGIIGLLPIAVNAVFDMIPQERVLQAYASEMVFMIIGANILTLSMERTGIDRRIASGMLRFIGPSVKKQLCVWFLLAALLTSVLPNIVVTVMLCSVAVSMLKSCGVSDISQNPAASMLLVCIAWGGNNGMLTPLGGAMNLIAVSQLEEVGGGEFFYYEWVLRLAPFFLLSVLMVLLYLIFFFRGASSEERFRPVSVESVSSVKLSREERMAVLLFLLPTAAAVTRFLWADFLPGMKPAFCFLAAALTAFFLKQRDGKPYLRFRETMGSLPWDIIFLFAGVDALGAILSMTGAAGQLAGGILFLSDNSLTVLLILVAAVICFSEIASSVAAAAVFCPVTVIVCEQAGLPAIPCLLIVCAAFNLSFALPVANKGVPSLYGVRAGFMIRQGLWLSLGAVALVTVLGWFFLKCIPGFSAL